MVGTSVYTPIAFAQKYPDRPVRLVAGFPPGGGVDLLGRIVAKGFSDLWGTSMIVENKGGASGNIGTEAVVKSDPNGYTLLLAPNTLTINPTVMKDVPFNVLTDLEPIGMIATTPLVLVVNSNVPAINLEQLLALAKRQPGTLNYGSSGPGSVQHLAGELINLTAGIKTVHVPYRAVPAIVQALITNELQMAYVSYTAVQGFVKQGRVRLIATLGRTRDPTVPELPTLAEAGLPGCEVDIWYGLFAPTNTRPTIVKQVNADLKRLLDAPGMKEAIVEKGFNLAYSTPEQAAEIVRKDLARWKDVADRINLR